MHITKATINDIQAVAGKVTLYWDPKLVGFGLKVSKTGAKVFIVQYRTGAGRRGLARRTTIGPLGKLTPDEARKAAKILLGQAAIGDDPASQRSAKRKEMTVAELVDYYAEYGGLEMKPRAKRNKVNGLKHHVVPLIGRKIISNVDSDDITDLIRDITNGKTAKDEIVAPRKRIVVRGGQGAARKVSRDLSSVFEFALSKKHLKQVLITNPCRGVKKGEDRKRTRYLSAEEIRRLGIALDTLARDGTNPKGIAIVKLWVVSGARRDEIAGLRWSEVDLERGVLVLADTKTGQSFRPLPEPARVILSAVPRGGSEFVFPAESGASFYSGTRDVFAQACKIAGINNATPHTLRHTLASHSVSSGISLAATAGILGQKDLRATQRYAHLQPHVAAMAAEQIANQLATELSNGLSKGQLQAGEINDPDESKSDSPVNEANA